MINSKAVKDFPKSSKLEIWWYNCPLSDVWDNITWFFVKPYRQIKKLFQWQINVFKNDYDFEGHCLYAIIEYKLKRLQKVLENGHVWQETQDMHALALAIKLAGRLREDKYEEKEWLRHDRKWGEMQWKTDRVASKDKDGKPKTFHFDTSRPNVKTPEDKTQETAEFLASIARADAAMHRDQKRFYGILDKYLRVWWD